MKLHRISILEMKLYMDKAIDALLKDLKDIEHGFRHIIRAGDTILGTTDVDHLKVAIELLQDESYQSRMLAVYLLGELAPTRSEALKVLETIVARDSNWRVQEMLAKAFDSYCAKIGYEASLPKINRWLSDDNPNVKRAVIEGLRIWTGRPYFKQNPKKAIDMISQYRSTENEYLRKSVGNALRDISKKFPELVQEEITSWDITNKNILYTVRLIKK